MATVRRVSYLKARLKDKPGALLNIMQGLKKKNLGLVGLWGYSTFGGKAELYVVANKTAKVKALWRPLRLSVQEGKGFWITGKNQTGALNKCLEALRKSRVNIVGIQAIAVGERYGSFVWVKSNRVGKAARALKAK
jgi:hypothetical protein